MLEGSVFLLVVLISIDPMSSSELDTISDKRGQICPDISFCLDSCEGSHYKGNICGRFGGETKPAIIRNKCTFECSKKCNPSLAAIDMSQCSHIYRGSEMEINTSEESSEELNIDAHENKPPIL